MATAPPAGSPVSVLVNASVTPEQRSQLLRLSGSVGFDELACHCGLTVLYPPIDCGTKPPECKNMCTRRHECDHPGE